MCILIRKSGISSVHFEGLLIKMIANCAKLGIMFLNAGPWFYGKGREVKHSTSDLWLSWKLVINNNSEGKARSRVFFCMLSFYVSPSLTIFKVPSVKTPTYFNLTTNIPRN